MYAEQKEFNTCLEHTEGLPFDSYFMLPSCVPATQFEEAGALLNSEDLLPFYEQPRVLGLAEVMNSQAVFEANLQWLRNCWMQEETIRLIDGHAAGLYGKAIGCVYVGRNSYRS